MASIHFLDFLSERRNATKKSRTLRPQGCRPSRRPVMITRPSMFCVSYRYATLAKSKRKRRMYETFISLTTDAIYQEQSAESQQCERQPCVLQAAWLVRQGGVAVAVFNRLV